MRTPPILIVGALVLSACSGSAAEPTSALESAATTAPATSATAAETTSPQTTVPSTTAPAHSADQADGAADELFPDVVGAEATQAGDGSWTFSVTLSSPYDTPDRYADSWRVRNADGSVVFGERFLTHDHANEQPFTRSQSGIEIPDNVASVVIEGRDQVSGWGGATLELELDRS